MTASAADPTATEPSPNWRVAPSVPAALGVSLAYVVVFIGLSSTSGIPYAEWFDSGANAFRTAVIPLIGGSLVLLAFLFWARWDFVFKDPARLPMGGILWVPVVIFIAGIVAHFAVADWGGLSAGLLLAILASGAMVGFAEETLFRGVILRGLRTNLRPEAWVMLISSLLFGLFHLTNLLNGSPLVAVLNQVAQACALGAVLYVFRRARGLLVVGMVVHALWDISLFVPAPTGTLAIVGLGVQVLLLLSAVIAAIVLVRSDRAIAVTRTGIQTLEPQAAREGLSPSGGT
jgi:membrane protease YdiL (CAAX protease family)